MGRFRKGERLACVPCGREVTISWEGVSGTTLWCCGSPMSAGAKKRAPARKTKKKIKKRR